MSDNNGYNIGGNKAFMTEKTVRGPFGGTYDVMEFFPCMETNWDKASRCLRPLLPMWLQKVMYGKVLSRNNVKLLSQYEDLAEVQRAVSVPMTEEINRLLNESSQVTVSAAYCKVEVKGVPSFGVMINITQFNTTGPTMQRHFEGFVNLQDRTQWEICSVPDVNERTPNDPAWLMPSKTTRMNGLTELPMAMRLDMLGQYLVESGWTEYKVHGQQLLLIADLVVRKHNAVE